MSAIDRYRLPRNVLPSRYELTLEPDLDAARFSGEVRIDVEVREPLRELVLNALELEVDQAWLERNGTRIEARPECDAQTERCTMHLESTAAAGEWTLGCRFRGVLNDRLEGFYRSRFKDASGVERVIATTQMESTHARLVFPCWDEPDLKATFAVTLVVPDGMLALSNGAEVSSTAGGDGRKRVVYAETMKMSTYLVAFVVGPLEITDPVDAGGTPLRVAYPPERGALTAFALESGAFALDYFSRYYGIGYPADKLDLVAIPDFAAGAMENLGCITFRETALLVDPATATQPELQRVADVVHHEIAHMWFGDLVTMRWWNGLWLNEAFATFMEMKCTDAFRPRWERWVDFGISRTAAFEVDSLESTRPIEYEVISPRDSEGMFDILTYEKGAAVLRMLEQHLGEDAFREGVRRYLTAHAYGNTDTTDLWDSLEEATGRPVRQMMDGWIFGGGYPLVSAALGDGSGAAALELTQRRFSYRPENDRPDNPEAGTQVWQVPVQVRYGRAGGQERTAKLLLASTQASFALEFEPDWLVVNAGATGFFRVDYSARLLAGLTGDGLAALTPSERYGLVDDRYAAMVAGRVTASDMLDLVRRLSGDTDLSVWQRMAGVLGSLARVVAGSALPAYQQEIRRIVRPALERLGPEAVAGESERTAQLRGTLFETLGTVGADPQVRDQARAVHRDFAAGKPVDPSLAAACIGVIADSGDQAEFELFWQRHQQAPSPQLAVRYLHSLGRFPDSSLTARLLELAVTEVRTQDAPFTLGRALTNKVTGRLVWDFIAQRWEVLIERFPANSIVRMLAGVATIGDRSWAGAVEAFMQTHPVPQGEKTMAQNLERMGNRVRVRERESERFSRDLLGPG